MITFTALGFPILIPPSYKGIINSKNSEVHFYQSLLKTLMD